MGPGPLSALIVPKGSVSDANDDRNGLLILMKVGLLQGNLNHCARARNLMSKSMAQWLIHVAVMAGPYYDLTCIKERSRSLRR